jgi:NADPH-ferrihemoprotein reductase
MYTLSKMLNLSSLVSVDRLLQHAQTDDIVFLILAIFSGIFYNVYIRDKPDPYYHRWFEKPQQTDANHKGPETRDIAAKFEESVSLHTPVSFQWLTFLIQKKDLVIFWGSQSGTAEGFANRLVRDCRSRFGLDALAADLSDYDSESIANIPKPKIAIFIISTYGDGDPSDNAASFLSWLGANKTIQFSNLRYAAFGLGNKHYKFYNKVIDVVTEGLNSREAIALLPTGKADDSKGTTDEDFTEWKYALFKMFHEKLGLEERPAQYEPVLRVVEKNSLEPIDLNVGEPVKAQARMKGAATSPIQALPIKVAKKLLTTKTRNCLHLELDTTEFPELKYKTGDHLAVWPSNPSLEIQRLVKVLGLHERLRTPLLIQSLDRSVKVKVPSPTTWEALLRYYLEICAPVSRETIAALAQFAPSDASRDTLKSLGEDKHAYYEYCFKTHVTLGRLLESVSTSRGSWSNLPLALVIESLPTLSPRYYSISSSSIVSPKQISITIATSSEMSANQSIFIPGLAIEYLLCIEQQKRNQLSCSSDYELSGPNNVLDNGQKLFAHIRTSKFRLPTLPKNPIIMIASGSGIAPFRGFIYERARMFAIGREVGESLLFFGCRSQDDYLYREELQDLQASNKEIDIVTAFSRAGDRKFYVQDRVEEMREEVVRLLVEQNAYLYVCGSAKMARDVGERLGVCLRLRMGWSEAELRAWSEGVKKAHRWQEDVWG